MIFMKVMIYVVGAFCDCGLRRGRGWCLRLGLGLGLRGRIGEWGLRIEDWERSLGRLPLR